MGLTGWNLILGQGWLRDPSGSVWGRGKEPGSQGRGRGSWKPGVRESLGSWDQRYSTMLTLLSLTASNGEDPVLEALVVLSRDHPSLIN